MNMGSEQVVTFKYKSEPGKPRPAWTYRKTRRNALKRKTNLDAQRKPQTAA